MTDGGVRAENRLVKFTLKLAWALHRQGAPAHRLEEVLQRLAAELNLVGQFFAVPTALIAGFGSWEKQQTFLVRADAGEVNLAKLVDLDQVAQSVVARKMTPEEGLKRIDAIVEAPPRYGRFLTAVCSGGASFAAARFFGGDLRELAIATVVGWMLGLLHLATRGSPGWRRVYAPLASVLASIVVPLLALGIGNVSTSIAVLGGIIMLVPGLTVTTAMSELATKHLLAGTGRLMGAMTEFLIMGLGVLIGSRIAAGVPAAAGEQLAALPAWTEVIALFVGLASFVVLFRVPLREAPWSVLVATIVYTIARLATGPLGPDLSVGLAALVLGLSANVYAFRRNKPSSIIVVPGLMLLVPGSVGFRSILSLLDRSVLSGVETAFQMGMVATSLATGLLLANIVLPPRRAL